MTVTGDNVPVGDNLVIYNQSTGQLVGSSQSTPYSVQTSEPTPQTDNFVAYISTNTSNTGALMSSNVVPVDWYGISLTANPTALPVNNTSTLTATAQNVPSGYVVDILDQTTNQVIATGQPGQTVLNALETKHQVETDKYVAQIVKPGNPSIPSLNVPASAPPDGLFSETSTEIQHYNPTTNSMENIAGLPITTGTSTSYGTVNTAYFTQPLVYAPNTQVIYAGVEYSTSDSQYTHEFVALYAYDLKSGTWTQVQMLEDNYMPGFIGATMYWFDEGLYNPVDHKVYLMYTTDGMYDYTWQLESVDPTNPTAAPSMGLGVYEDRYYDPGAHHGDGQWITLFTFPFNSFTIDPKTGILYYPGSATPEPDPYEESAYGSCLMEYNPFTGTASILNGANTFAYPSDSIGYDSANGLVYYATWTQEQSAPFDTNGELWSYDPNTGTSTELVALPNSSSIPYVNVVNGLVLIQYNGNYIYNPSTNSISSSPISINAIYDSQLNEYVDGGSFYDSNLNYVKSVGMSSAMSYGVSAGGPITTVKNFPYWTFTKAPGYVPTSLFTQNAQAGSYNGSIWVSNASSQINGTAFFESTFNLPQTESVTFNMPQVDDYAQVYVDGQPVLQQGNDGGVGGSIPDTSTATITLPAGMHQVLIEAENNNNFTSSSSGTAGVTLNVTSGGAMLLTTSNAGEWETTGYITQLPTGWFSGAIGTWTWTEYVMQEGQSTPISQQQSYSLTTAAGNVSATSNEVSVTWFNPVTPPDNFTLAALPTQVVKPASTDFKITLDKTDQDFVNQALNGDAQLVVKCQQTWQSVVSANWAPDTDGLNVAIPYTPVAGTSLQYVAELVDPNTGNPVAISNEVTVTDSGNGSQGNSYTTETCGPNGDGTEIFTTYTNGQVTSTKTVPLTMTGLEVSGIYHPTEDLQQDLGLTAKIKMPVTNTEVGNGPIPLRVQAPFAFAITFPQAQPTSVTATFTVNQHDAVDENGDTSWTVTMKPANNLGFGVWQGATIMPKLPDGDTISIQITATDECGTATTPTGVFPYDDFLVTSDDPEWYYIQPGTGNNSTTN
ncbi:hypothetical protein [Alicyclobacillus suci]|uniref:hypothetical protein n=1 Tax=Alicyclobacillus suci TaxID=2816080 RepID=UPI001A8ECBBE|nr:hypothetical protein [Alicyclobacillus suci]